MQARRPIRRCLTASAARKARGRVADPRVALPLLVAALLFFATPTAAPAAQEYSLSGIVTAQGGSTLGVTNTQVTVSDSLSGEQVVSTTTGIDGSYSVRVPAGTYDVAFTPPLGSGYRPFTDHGENVTTDRLINVVLVPAGLVRFSGVVRDPLGSPVVGARLNLSGSGSTVSVVTGADGAFEFNVSPGSYGLQLLGSREGSEQVPGSFGLEATIDLSSDRVQDLTIPSVVVDVLAVGPSGDPVAGARIEAGGGMPPVPLYPGDTQDSKIGRASCRERV